MARFALYSVVFEVSSSEELENVAFGSMLALPDGKVVLGSEHTLTDRERHHQSLPPLMSSPVSKFDQQAALRSPENENEKTDR
uniref:Uncharacterized protein n=1 Tax=Anopheles dirus TaxID=7168 RepID=A0A182NPZ8_9DIPT